MSRAPFQVLVFPYMIDSNGEILCCVFRRQIEDGGYWQAIAGGGEGAEAPLDAAIREGFEEAGIPEDCEYVQMDSCATIPVADVCGFLWGSDILVIPEYAFAVRVVDAQIALSREHTDFRWVDYDTATQMLKWDSNRTALWELDFRLRAGLGFPGPAHAKRS